MNDREFYTEVRKGLIIIMRAMLRRYIGMSWLDFLPREVAESYVSVTGLAVATQDTTRRVGTGV